jgi:phage shock protein PspC (stress-responsive transcriptional regulator)
MQKVITINLNGVAYQLDEAAHTALVAYLDRASAALQDNPDRAEILADLEQAIAEKCRRFLNANKTVVALPEIDEVLKEMGPVDTPAADPGARTDPGKAGTPGAGDAPKRLYQIREGAMISGACNGLGAYLNVDVTLVRIVFVVLALATKGLWIVAYLILMFVVPYADTSEERAAAQGLPFNARELIDRARKNFTDGQTWRRRERRRRRTWRHDQPYPWWAPPAPAPMGYAGHLGMGLLMPALVLASLAGFLLLAFVVVSLVNTRAAFGWSLPPDVPVWAAILIACALYLVVVSPLHAARNAARHAHGWYAAWDGVLWLAIIGVAIWMASSHGPEIRDALHRFFQNLPGVWRDLRQSAQAAWDAGRSLAATLLA